MPYFAVVLWSLSAVLSSGMAWAQDTPLAHRSMHCAVLMDALSAALPEGDAQASHLQRASAVFLEVHTQALRPAKAEAAPMASRQQAIKDQWRGADAAGKDRLREEAIVCGAWAEGFLIQGEAYRYVPVYPKIVAPTVRAQYGALADQLLHTLQP